ncbi:MAG: redoxin family protein [Acidimicrobiia bacterium]|nr:redoxin family protein [Acidimicrobiia bacterium]
MTTTRQRTAGGRVAWFAIAGVAIFIVVAIVLATRFGSDPTLTASPLVGRPAPEEPIRLADGSGAVSVADLRGDIVVVNFWASWCLPCREEHAALVQGANDYAAFDTTFVAVNYQDDPDRAAAFLAELGSSPETIYAVDEGSATAFAWGVLGLPETFFIDRDGVVVGKVSGPLTYGLLSATIEQIILGEAVGEITTGDVENR